MGAAWWGGMGDPERIEIHFAIDLPEGMVELPRGQGGNITITPDGQSIAFVGLTRDGSRRLFRRALDAVGVERFGASTRATTPSFGGSNEWIAFGADVSQYDRLQITGGESFSLCASCQDATWADDGSFFFTDGGSLFPMAAACSGRPPTGPSANWCWRRRRSRA